MKIKRFYYLFLPVITLILEILPFGAVCNFAVDGGGRIRETFSYFSLIPFGYANFSPFLTAVTTCAILLVILIYVISGKRAFAVVSKVLLCIAVGLSLCPLLYGVSYFSVVGGCISLTLATELLFIFVADKS